MDEIVNAIVRYFDGAAQVTRLLGALALIGVATTAVIQAVKETTTLRRRYQEHRLREWLLKRCNSLDDAYWSRLATVTGPALPTRGDVNRAAEAAQQDLYQLTVDGEADALLDLPIEEVAMQMDFAFRAAVDSPRRYALLVFLSGQSAALEDLERLYGGVNDDRDRVHLAEARSRVLFHMQRAVAGFQLGAAYRWKFYLQLASFGVSGGLAFLALRQESFATGLVGVLLVAVIAGFLAPVARDITVVLNRLRGGTV